MNQELVPAQVLTPSSIAPAQIFAETAVVRAGAPQRSLELLYSFIASQTNTDGGQVIAFTSVHGKEGVSHVVRMVGRQLAAYRGQDVLIISPPDLRRLRPLDVEQIDTIGRQADAGVWTLPERPDLSQADGTQEDVWRGLRRRFQYVLLDCSALELSGEIFSLAPRVDGTVLVVQAGRASKPEIQKAARLLSVGNTPFLGCILNQRTYPVPGFLYRTL